MSPLGKGCGAYFEGVLQSILLHRYCMSDSRALKSLSNCWLQTHQHEELACHCQSFIARSAAVCECVWTCLCVCVWFQHIIQSPSNMAPLLRNIAYLNFLATNSPQKAIDFCLCVPTQIWPGFFPNKSNVHGWGAIWKIILNESSLNDHGITFG